MWGNGKRHKPTTVDTMIGQRSEVQGDIAFSGGLHVDGTIKGNVTASGDESAVLTLSEHGTIEGEVRVPNVILNGTVRGDVYASERIELAARARITGDVYYNLIEMAIGAEVNGHLVHRVEAARPVRAVERDVEHSGGAAAARSKS